MSDSHLIGTYSAVSLSHAAAGARQTRGNLSEPDLETFAELVSNVQRKFDSVAQSHFAAFRHHLAPPFSTFSMSVQTVQIVQMEVQMPLNSS